jgi:hypothetical protein
LGWGVLSFFIPPLGAVLAPFLVNTWGIFLVGVALFIIGNMMTRNAQSNLIKRQVDYSRSLDSMLANQVMEAEVIGRANATLLIPGMQPYGPGKLFGSPNGELFWVGDGGYQFNIERNLKKWGLSLLATNSKDLFITLTTGAEFAIDSEHANQWKEWLKKHYAFQSNLEEE